MNEGRVSQPKARSCADCQKPLDYAAGRWMNVAPEGTAERIVCRRCWRENYRKPPPVAAKAAAPQPVQPAQPVDVNQALVAAFTALAARAARDELRRERRVEAARKRGD